jgi:hypothetical protein
VGRLLTGANDIPPNIEAEAGVAVVGIVEDVVTPQNELFCPVTVVEREGKELDVAERGGGYALKLLLEVIAEAATVSILKEGVAEIVSKVELFCLCRVDTADWRGGGGGGRGGGGGGGRGGGGGGGGEEEEEEEENESPPNKLVVDGFEDDCVTPTTGVAKSEARAEGNCNEVTRDCVFWKGSRVACASVENAGTDGKADEVVDGILCFTMETDGCIVPPAEIDTIIAFIRASSFWYASVSANCLFIQASSDVGEGRSNRRLKSPGIDAVNWDEDEEERGEVEEDEEEKGGEVEEDDNDDDNEVELQGAELDAVDIDARLDSVPTWFDLSMVDFDTNEKLSCCAGGRWVAIVAASAATASRNEERAAVLFGIPTTAGVADPWRALNDEVVVGSEGDTLNSPPHGTVDWAFEAATEPMNENPVDDTALFGSGCDTEGREKADADGVVEGVDRDMDANILLWGSGCIIWGAGNEETCWNEGRVAGEEDKFIESNILLPPDPRLVPWENALWGGIIEEDAVKCVFPIDGTLNCARIEFAAFWVLWRAWFGWWELVPPKRSPSEDVVARIEACSCSSRRRASIVAFSRASLSASSAALRAAPSSASFFCWRRRRAGFVEMLELLPPPGRSLCETADVSTPVI